MKSKAIIEHLKKMIPQFDIISDIFFALGDVETDDIFDEQFYAQIISLSLQN